MKKIIIVLSALFYFFTIPVFASEEDILKEPVKEQEEIKEDKEKDNNNLIKAPQYTNDINQAQSIRLYFDSISMQLEYNIPNFNIGDKYYIVINNDFWDIQYRGYKINPSIGYFVRGSESVDMPVILTNNEEIINGYITIFMKTLEGDNYFDFYIYEEPTPDPTPDPTPEPEPEEPEVDLETISGNEILREILRTNREINESVQGIYKLLSNNCISDSVISDNTVSDNIIYKKLEDYNTSESLALIGLVLAFGALLVYVIHKSVFKIRR